MDEIAQLNSHTDGVPSLFRSRKEVNRQISLQIASKIATKVKVQRIERDRTLRLESIKQEIRDLKKDEYEHVRDQTLEVSVEGAKLPSPPKSPRLTTRQVADMERKHLQEIIQRNKKANFLSKP